MTKPSRTEPSEAEAPPRGAFNAPYRPLKMTATLKRRALKKRPGKLAIAAQSVIE
jgi:hypothetical protein